MAYNIYFILHSAWLKRLREIVNQDSLLIISSRESKWTSKQLLNVLNKE
jgi:hypothetical protein